MYIKLYPIQKETMTSKQIGVGRHKEVAIVAKEVSIEGIKY
jgi:hypothetical protein